MKILLMGPPASGKGTVGDRLSDCLGIPLISVGNVLRNMPADHPRYLEIKSLLEQGQLAPQDFVAELLRSRVDEPDCANGYIFDGWGRKMVDLEFFNPGFDKVIALKLSLESAISRITNRRVCSNCGEVYNLLTVPPKEDGVCDKCGGKLIQRGDDSIDVVKKRYKEQWEDAQEVVEMFRKEGILLEIDAEPEPAKVFDSVLAALNISENSH